MNNHDAKKILLAYRPGTTDAEDPEVSAALELARRDAELGRWLEIHCARQAALRDKVRQIQPPPGLKEQILSEYAASRRRAFRPTHGVVIAALALFMAVVAGSLLLNVSREKALDAYRTRMATKALSAYSMNLISSDAPKILDFLKQHGAPADYTLPPALAKAPLVGCATPKWEGAKVSMLCFRTGRPLPSGALSDLWLFVIDRESLAHAPPPGPPVINKVNKLMTAMWTRGDKTYLLGVEGEESYLRTFL